MSAYYSQHAILGTRINKEDVKIFDESQKEARYSFLDSTNEYFHELMEELCRLDSRLTYADLEDGTFIFGFNASVESRDVTGNVSLLTGEKTLDTLRDYAQALSEQYGFQDIKLYIGWTTG